MSDDEVAISGYRFGTIEFKADPKACAVLVESVIKGQRRARRRAWLARIREASEPWIDLGGEG